MYGKEESSGNSGSSDTRYTPPKVVRYGMLNTGFGDCANGSGEARTCQTGFSAAGNPQGGCEAGVGALTKCEANGSSALNVCDATGNGVA